MKKIILLMISLVLAALFSGCGGGTSEVITESNTLGEAGSSHKVRFIIGEENSSVGAQKMARSAYIEQKISSGIKITGRDILAHIESVCLQIFVEGSDTPIVGKCEPVIAGVYPVIELDESKIPEESFKAKIVGYNYNTTYWQGIYEDIISETNTKVFDPVLVSLGLQNVYMGDLHPKDNVKLPLSLMDSTGETDFSQYSNVYLVSEDGIKNTYNRYDISIENFYADVWYQKDVVYDKLCLDDICYIIPSSFDPFNGNLDISALQKVEMTPISTGICSIKYNQEFHQVIDISPDKYNYQHYVEITDCDQSQYYFRVRFSEFDNIRSELKGDISRYIENKSMDGEKSFTIKSSDVESLAYFYVEYWPESSDIEGNKYYPSMTIEVIDNETDEVIQSESFNMTSFEFVNIN